MTDLSYNITVTFNSTNNYYEFSGNDEQGIFNGNKDNLKFQTNSSINFTLDFSNNEDLSFVISSFINNEIIAQGGHEDLVEISNNDYIFYRFGPTQQSISGIIEIYSTSIKDKIELLEILDKKRNIINDPTIKSDTQPFNTAKRRFLANFNYIMSDSHNLITDSSGIVDDMIIQSVSADLHLVTTDDRKIHCWAGETIIEEDLVIKGDLIMDFNKAGFTINILSNNNDASFNNVDINGSLKVNDISIATLNTTNLTNYTLSGQLYTQTQLHSGTLDLSFQNVDISGNLDVSGINVYNKFLQLDSSINNIISSGSGSSTINLQDGSDASFNNVDISGTLKVNNIEALNDISSGLGEIDVSFVGNSLSIDAKNMLYATKYINYNSNIDISNLEIINFKNNSQIAIYCDNSNGTIVFRGSNNGGINNSKSNFIDDISLNNTDSLITLTKINNTNLLMVSEFK